MTLKKIVPEIRAPTRSLLGMDGSTFVEPVALSLLHLLTRKWKININTFYASLFI